MKYIEIELNNDKRVFKCELLKGVGYNTLFASENVSQDTVIVNEVVSVFSDVQVSTDFYRFTFDNNVDRWVGMFRTSCLDGKSVLIEAIRSEVYKLNWNF
jgi:hypothetical protein